MSKRIKGVIVDDEFVHMEMHEGKIRCTVCVLDSDEILPELTEKVIQLAYDENLFCDEGEVLTMHFTPARLLDYYVDGWGYYGSKSHICSEVKPQIDQLRIELQVMIDRIDQLQYVQDTAAQ